MPYIPYSLEDEQKKAAQNSAVNVSGASNVINQNSQSVSAPKPTQRSGSWTNLNSYLDANKDNAASMGQNIANNIKDSGVQARNSIQNTQLDFNSMVDKGSIANFGTAKEDSDSIINQAKTSSLNSQINDDQVSRFKEVSNASYKGPQDLTASQYYQDSQSKVNKAKENQINSQTDEGRFGLLQNMFNKPTYSQGQKNLDNLLIQGNQQAKDAIKNSADSLNDLQSNWDKVNTDSSNLANQRKTDTDLIRQYAQNGLSTNRDVRSNEVEADLTDKQTHWNDQYNHYNDLLSNFKGGELALTQDEMNTLALKNNGQQIFNTLNGVPASTYLTQKAFDANKVVGKDQFAQLSALDKLANQFGLSSLNRFSNIDDAGTLGVNNNIDGSAFGSATEKAKQNFNDYANKTNVNASSGKYTPYGDEAPEFWTQANMSGLLANQLDGINANTSYQYGAGAPIVGSREVTSEIAKNNFMSQLQSLLNQQGFSNKVKIKE